MACCQVDKPSENIPNAGQCFLDQADDEDSLYRLVNEVTVEFLREFLPLYFTCNWLMPPHMQVSVEESRYVLLTS